MYFGNYKYSNDNDNILSLNPNIKKGKNIQKGFLDIKLFTDDGNPVNDANIKVVANNKNKCYSLKIDAIGFCPYLINNVRVYPNSICKIDINLTPLKQKKKQKIKQNIETSKSETDLLQNEVRYMTLNLGMDSPIDTVSFLYAEKLAEEVNKLSNGKMKIDIFTDGKLGTDRQMIQRIKQDDGNIHFIVQNTAPQVDFIPNISLFDIPLVYFNITDLRNAIDNEAFYEKISKVYQGSGYKLLGIADQLFRQMTTNKKIQNIDDFEGIKIRTIQNRNHEAFWEALGAIIIPLPVSQIYPSLKRNFIDAQENPYENIVALKLYELQEYVINTYHLPHLVTLITSDKFFNSLTTAEKLILEKAAITATSYARNQADERIENRKQFLIDKGMMLVDLPIETLQALRTASIPVYEKIRNSLNDDELINAYFGN